MTDATIECERLVEDYVQWLQSNIEVVKVGKACQISTPFLDRHNDYMQFYVEPFEGRYRLTDDGYTIRDLEQSGVDLSTSSHRSQLLDLTLNGLGVSKEGDELVVEAQENELPQKEHSLLQAMLSVNDMFLTAKQQVIRIFFEDVELFLRKAKVRFTPRVKFSGQSKFDHNFDFVVPASDKAPERIIRAINHPSRDAIKLLIFAWTDTKLVRPKSSKAYAFLNDEERPLGGKLISALKAYDMIPVPWSKRAKYQEELAN